MSAVARREQDLKMLRELLDEHPDELKDSEVEAFASMRFDLTRPGGFIELTDKQRAWVKSAFERFSPQYENLVSSGRVPRGREVPTPPILQNLPKKPPPRSKK